MLNQLIEAFDRARPLCPDHRDKQRGKSCLACRIETLERALQFYADKENWDMQNPIKLDPEYVPGGLFYGWTIAEKALNG